MPLRSSLLTFKSLGLSRLRSRKEAKNPVKSATSSTAMEGLQSPQSSSNAIYRLHNFDELVKRLNTVFILYQIPLSEGRPIVFDEFRCNHALNLRLLLSIRSSDLLESDLMVSNFELHDLGLRLPENPLNVNPTCDYGIKIRRAFQDELGTVFINTSLEVLGLATVLHVVERTISWLEPLLSPDGIRQVQANITAALQPSSVLSQPLVTICERSHDLQRQASKPSLYNNVLSSRRSDFTNFRADVELRPEFSAYNFDKEFPADALDRWVLEARSQGHEPTLMECTQKLKRLEIDYKVYRHERGYPPPPVSARYGYIDHALSRQYRESRATNQRTRTSLRLRPMQQPMTFRQEAEMLVAATTTLPRRIVPQKYYQTIANTSQRPIFNEPKLNRSQSNFAMLAMNSPASLPKTPRRRLAFTGSPLKRQNRLQITIGTPSRFTHEISGAGLKSWNEMAKAVEAANTRALHPPRDDSIQENLFNLARANSSNLVEGQVKASGSNVATKRRASDIRSPSPPQDTAFGKAIAREPAKIHKDCTDNACHRPVLASTAFDESMGEKARVGFEQQTSTSLEDRDAKVEALLTQLLLMQDVFRKARESLAASVGSQFIEKVTDIAVAYGWFRANFEDHVDNKTNKGDRTRSS